MFFRSLCFVSFFSFSLFSADDLALIGGNKGCLSVVDLETGVSTSVGGSVPSFDVDSVSANSEGLGLAGGDRYLATVDLNTGVATNVTGDFNASDGGIYGVSINESGNGIVAGYTNGANYLGFVSPEGVSSKITAVTNLVTSVSINDSNEALVGAYKYAAIISGSGGVTNISTSDLTGAVNSVAYNNSSQGLVGGGSFLGSVSGGSLGTLSTSVYINSVDINSLGQGVAGGTSATGRYLVQISSSGGVTPLGSTFSGSIQSTSINSSGEMIVGGQMTPSLQSYLSLFSPEGVETSITGITSSNITAVAIDDTGFGVAGGNDGKTYLISPIGVATSVTGDVSTSQINSISISRKVVVVPQSPGAIDVANNFVIPVFAFSSQTLPNHMVGQRNQGMGKLYEENSSSDIALLADAGDVVMGTIRSKPEFQKEEVVNTSCKEAQFSIWGSPFGNYAVQKEANAFPEAKISSVGAMLGFDYLGMENALVGGGAAYAYHYVSAGDSQGHAKTHQALFSIYASKTIKYFYANAALWAGPYWTDNTRHSLMGRATSTSDIKGWILVPHLEMSFPFYTKKDWCIVDPFLMFDYANNWQGAIHEKGASGFNINVESHYISILRSEGGLRFFERVDTSWGSVTFTEKMSYVNKKPFGNGRSTAFFTGAASSFGIDVFSNQVQNLGVVQLGMEFTPKTTKYPYGSINFQHEFGTSFHTSFASFEIGKSF